MTLFLADSNVLLALVYDKHEHHARAQGWFSGLEPGQLLICRVTQMALLRLVTNEVVMSCDVVSHGEAWSIYDRLRADGRIDYLSEPAGSESEWRRRSLELRRSPKSWTDCYLAALASRLGCRLATFDVALSRREADVCELIPTA